MSSLPGTGDRTRQRLVSMSESKDQSGETPPGQTKASLSTVGKLGVALILLSGVCFFSMFAVPWLPIEGSHKLMLGGALFVAMQIAWWTGAVLAGPAVVTAIVSRLPRFRKS